MTLDARARQAAHGIHRAVALMELSPPHALPNIERFDRFCARRSRNRRFAAVVIGIAVPLVMVLAGILLSSDPPEVAGRGTPPPNPPSSEGKPSFVDLRTGEITPLPESIASDFIPFYRVSPDGTKLAFSRCCNPPDPTFIANVDGTGVRRVTPGGMDAAGASWSPDGSMLVYQGRDGATFELGNLFVVDVTTEEVRRITDLRPQMNGWWFMWPSFAPDGSTILFHLPRRDEGRPGWDLWSVPVSGGEPVLVRRNAGFGTYSPDGRKLAYLSPLSGNATGEALWLADVSDGAPRALVDRAGIWWPSWSPDGSRIAYAVGTNDIFIVEVATGETAKVAEGGVAEWFDDHTLIVAPYCCRG